MYKNPVPTVDIIIEKDDRIVLITRKNEPFKGKLALLAVLLTKGN